MTTEYEEQYLYVVKNTKQDTKAKFLHRNSGPGLCKMYSPLGALIYVYIGTYNHHICDYAWSKYDGIAVGAEGRRELIAEWAALHHLWPEFIALATNHEEVRQHITTLRAYSSLRFDVGIENVSGGDPELSIAEQICRSIDAQIACMEALK